MSIKHRNKKYKKLLSQASAKKEEINMVQMKINDRIEALKNALSEGLYEKDEVVRLALLTAIAQENIFMLGPPGCAKSMVARLITHAFKADDDKSIKFFETLLNQFSTPEDVFGNISLKGLNGELEDADGNKKEEYRRLTENMLPDADIAFIDEIWKASPAILNTLLTIINEHKFHNGSKVEDVPLKALLAASNEVPEKNRGLEALYDRFILRVCIDFIQDEDNFFDMIEGSQSLDYKVSDKIKEFQISNDELQEWKDKIDDITISEEAKAVISAIRKELTLQNNELSEEEKASGEAFIIGDRRWKKIAHILKASAFLNNRNEVDLMDCSLIEYCIWSTERQHKMVRKIVQKCIKQNGLDCDSAIDEINEQINEFEKRLENAWFETVKEPETNKIIEVDGQKCYECIRDGTNETWYVTVEGGKHNPRNAHHDIYDANKNYYTYDSFNNISCNYTFTVKKNPAKTYLKKKEFSDIAQETMQKKFDREHYRPIVDRIDAEIKTLKEKKERDAIPFRANLFANQEYNKNLTSKIDEAISELEKAEIDLDKQHYRYFDDKLNINLCVGDVILSDGIIYSSKEINKITENEEQKVIAIVCSSNDKIFAIGINEKKITWYEINEYASQYGNSLPQEYAQNWIIPNKEQLNEIWENMDKINDSLRELGFDDKILTPQGYWSSSEKEDTVAFYQLFDENGTQDHTTKDHPYATRAIREWKK